MLVQSGKLQLKSNNPSETENKNTATFTEIKFGTPFPECTTPVVLPFVQTFKGTETPGLRIAEITNVGFKVRFNEIVTHQMGHMPGGALSDGKHVKEQVGYVALSV